jgi:hypothetical protein
MCDIVMESAKDVIDEMTKWYFEKDLDKFQKQIPRYDYNS